MEEPGGAQGPHPGEGDARDGRTSRWSSAHQRVFQCGRACPRRAVAGTGERYGRRLVGGGGPTARQEPGQYRRRERAQRTAGEQHRRDRRVGPVEQPGDQEGGADMDGRHRPGGVLPGGSAVTRRHREVTGVRGVPRAAEVSRTGVARTRTGHARDLAQREVHRALRGERAPDDRAQSGAAAGEGTYGGELRDGQGGREPPRHLPAVDRVMADGREHTADESERHGPDRGCRGTRAGAVGPVCAPRHLVTRHARPPSSPRPSSRRASRPIISRHGATRTAFASPRRVRIRIHLRLRRRGRARSRRGERGPWFRPPRRGTSSGRGRPGGTRGSTGGSAGCRASRPRGCGSAGVSGRSVRGARGSTTGRPGGRRPCR